jgi:4-hydroxy-3-methylbut-2-enyl diphosphate reductase
MAHPDPSTLARPALKILLTAPRGFCAGVDRAIKIVEMALQKFGAPVYVRHEIVHNRHVVDTLKDKGAIFVEELDEIPETDAPVIFSAHGVPRSVPADAKARRLFYLDATCPLVSKVHAEARAHHESGLEIVLIGHAGHPEVIGTLGQLPQGAAALVETAEDAQRFTPATPGGSPTSPDHLSGGRYGRHHRHPESALPRHRGPQEGRHLLCHHQPPGGGEGHCRALR